MKLNMVFYGLNWRLEQKQIKYKWNQSHWVGVKLNFDSLMTPNLSIRYLTGPISVKKNHNCIFEGETSLSNHHICSFIILFCVFQWRVNILMHWIAGKYCWHMSKRGELLKWGEFCEASQCLNVTICVLDSLSGQWAQTFTHLFVLLILSLEKSVRDE